MEPISGTAAFQAHWQQDERCEALNIGLFVLEPLKQPESEIENIDALLLLERSRIVPDIQEALLQSLGRKLGLKALVEMTRLRTSLNGLLQLALRCNGILVRVLCVGRKKGQALSFSEEPKHLRRLFIDNFDGPDTLRPERDVDQPISRAQVEQRLSIGEKPIPKRRQ